ncbi:MAG: M48 family metalloprotease [Candidatus Aenigmatarchaeota archaeon]
MILFFDPLYIALMIIGYITMIFLASFIAPKIAARFAGRFSLYTSMFILAILTIFTFSFTLYLIIYFAFQYLQISILNLFFSVLIGVIILNLITYLLSPLILKIAYGLEESKEVQQIVDKVKQKLNYKGKLIGVIARNFPLPNAFAFGNFIFGKYVAVTESMLKLTNEKELEAVIGHEIGHHMHKDNAIMLMFGLLPSILYFIGYYLITSRQEEKSAAFILLGIFAVIISFVVQILVLAFSRLREYFADLEGAKAAGKTSMQSALAKLHAYYSNNKEETEDTEDLGNLGKTLFIYAFTETLANPLVSINKKYIENLKKQEVSALEEFLSTHPPIPKRLRFLDSLPY